MKNTTTGVLVGIVVFIGILGLGGCKLWERESHAPSAPIQQGQAEQVANYAQMPDGSVVIDGQQINWVVSAWGSFPYGNWMYLEVNQQDGPGKQPGDGQIPVTVGQVVLSFTGLPAEVTHIMLGVKAVRDDQDQTFTERGRFAVVNGSVNIPVEDADLVSYFGVTHYSLWFQVLGGQNGQGTACGQIALTGVMPGGDNVRLSRAICFGTNPQPTPTPAPAAPMCGGTVVNGACFYYGGLGQSCDTVCLAHGNANAAATIAIGSGAASFAACDAVLSAIGAPALPTFGDNGCLAGIGCGYIPSGNGRQRCTTPATDTSTSWSTMHRACACNN